MADFDSDIDPINLVALRIHELKTMIHEFYGLDTRPLWLLRELLRIEQRMFFQGTTQVERWRANKWVRSYLDAEHSAPAPIKTTTRREDRSDD